jgi:hypothetical protein
MIRSIVYRFPIRISQWGGSHAREGTKGPSDKKGMADSGGGVSHL